MTLLWSCVWFKKCHKERSVEMTDKSECNTFSPLYVFLMLCINLSYWNNDLDASYFLYVLSSTTSALFFLLCKLLWGPPLKWIYAQTYKCQNFIKAIRQENWQWSTLWKVFSDTQQHPELSISFSHPEILFLIVRYWWLSGKRAADTTNVFLCYRSMSNLQTPQRCVWLTSAWEKAKFLNNHCGTCNAINLDPFIFKLKSVWVNAWTVLGKALGMSPW